MKNTLGKTVSALALGTAMALAPQAVWAANVEYADNAEFQAGVTALLAAGSGNHTLDSDDSTAVPVLISQNVVLPGASGTITVNHAKGEFAIAGQSGQSAALTLNSGSRLNLAQGAAQSADLYIGKSGTGALNVNGGTLNLGSGVTNALVIGRNGTGTLNISNGGVVNMGMGDGPQAYAQVFAGWDDTANAHGPHQITLNNGALNIGDAGASIRLGIYSTTHLVMTNGASIDSSNGASHFWLGQNSGEASTASLTDSSLTILGTGTNSAADDRYFFIGRSSGSGVFTQSGNSNVHIAGIALIGIGHGSSTGVYNMNGGTLEIGTAAMKNDFRVGVDFATTNSANATFNVTGGLTTVHGNLDIAHGLKADSTTNATVNISGGRVEVGKAVRFGGNTTVRTLNLNGGVLALAGNDAIQGSGSLNFNGGTIEAADDLAIAHNATLLAGGVRFDTNGTAEGTTGKVFEYTGVLSGVGGVEVLGEGLLALIGENTYTGDTTITSGTLVAANPSSWGTGAIRLNGGTLGLSLAGYEEYTPLLGSRLVAVANTSSVIDFNGGSYSLSDLAGMTGSGRVIIAGAGPLGLADLGAGFTGTLSFRDGTELFTTGANQFSAQSTLDLAYGSTLRIGEPVLGDMMMMLVDPVSHDQTIGGLSGAGNIESYATLTVGGNNLNTDYSGAMTGTGRLVKEGTGRLVMSGVSNYTGYTHVAEGELRVTGELLGSDVYVDASFSGTGTVSGLYMDEDARFLATIHEDDSADLLTVLDHANLGGSELVLTFNGTLPQLGTRFTLLRTEEDDSLTGRFTFEEQYLTAFLGLQDFYTSETAGVEMVRLRDFVDAAQTANQVSVATALDGFGTDSGNEAVDALLLLETDAEARAAFTQLSGDLHASLRSTLIDDSRTVRNTVLDRLETSNPAGIWGQASYGENSTDGTATSYGLKRDTQSFVLGLDVPLGESLVAGFAGSYADTDATQSISRDSAKLKATQVLAYVGAELGSLRLKTGAGYAWGSAKTRRSVNFEGFSDSLRGRYDTSVAQGFAEVGFRLPLGITKGGFVEPMAQVAVVNAKLGALAETGGDAALQAAAQDSTHAVTTLGARFGTAADAAISLQGRLGWQHAYGDLLGARELAFEDGESFGVSGIARARNAAVFNLGARLSVAKNVQFGLSYDGKLSSSISDHAGALSVRIGF